MAGDPLAARLAEIAVAPDAERHRLRQRCVETFAADARYRGDERFARVWLALAAASPDPGAVFDAMARHRVGESLALVWVARAFVAEKAKKFADADALFARGLEMNAKPRELLAKRRREFERRMRRHWLNNQQAPVVPKEPPVVREPPTPPRTVDEDATATATQVLALHKATAQPFAIFDEAAPLGDEFDDFIEEGRKMLAISHSRVCGGSDEVAVSETVWPALAELFKDEKEDSGILCLLPDCKGDAATYLDQEVVEPLSQMGFGDRLETCVYAKKDGAPHNSFRIIVSPSAVPADAPNKSDDKDTMSAADKADEDAGRTGEGKVI